MLSLLRKTFYKELKLRTLQLKKNLISDLLNDSLTEYAYDATMAGLYCKISYSDYGLTVSFVVVYFIIFFILIEFYTKNRVFIYVYKEHTILFKL